MDKPNSLIGLEAYLSTHSALDEIENSASSCIKEGDAYLKDNSEKLNKTQIALLNAGKKLDLSLLDYVSKCRKILNSGSLDIPVITPEVKALEKKFIEIKETIYPNSVSICGSVVIDTALLKVKYNSAVENSLFTYSFKPYIKLNSKWSFPIITILESDHQKFKAGEQLRFSQANSIVKKLNNEYGTIKYSIEYFFNDKLNHFTAIANIHDAKDLISQLNNKSLPTLKNSDSPHETNPKIKDFELYLQQHCILDKWELASLKEANAIEKYPIIYDKLNLKVAEEKMEYLYDLNSYISNARASLNSGNFQLPELPQVQKSLPKIRTLIPKSSKSINNSIANSIKMSKQVNSENQSKNKSKKPIMKDYSI